MKLLTRLELGTARRKGTRWSSRNRVSGEISLAMSISPKLPPSIPSPVSFFTPPPPWSSSSRFAGKSVIFHEFFATRKRRPFVSLPELFEYARESFIARKPCCCCCCCHHRRCRLDDSPKCQMKTSRARDGRVFNRSLRVDVG